MSAQAVCPSIPTKNDCSNQAAGRGAAAGAGSCRIGLNLHTDTHGSLAGRRYVLMKCLCGGQQHGAAAGSRAVTLRIPARWRCNTSAAPFTAEAELNCCCPPALAAAAAAAGALQVPL